MGETEHLQSTVCGTANSLMMMDVNMAKQDHFFKEAVIQSGCHHEFN